MYDIPILIFLRKCFRFQSSVGNGCHDILRMTFGLDYIATLNVRGFDYRCIIFGGRNEAIRLMNSSVLGHIGSL